MYVKDKALEMYGEIIVPSRDKFKEIELDISLLNKCISISSEVDDYDSFFNSFDLYDIAFIYQKMGQTLHSDSGDISDPFDTINEENNGVPVVSHELFPYVETLLKSTDKNINAYKIGTFAKAIELIAYDYANYKCSKNKDHKVLVKRCKENIEFLNFFKAYYEAKDNEEDSISENNFKRPQKNIVGVGIQYGHGLASGTAKMPPEWFEFLAWYFQSSFQKEAKIKVAELFESLIKEAEIFLKKYSRESIRNSELLRDYAVKLDSLLKEFGITTDFQRHTIVGDIFGVLKIYPGREKHLNSEAAIQRFSRTNADKIQKAIKRNK